MNCENFEIVDSIALATESDYFDLHSNYDFVGFSFDVESSNVTLKWKKSDQDWAKEEKFEILLLNFKTVSLFKTKERDSEMPVSEDLSLSFIGFLHPEDVDTMDGFLEPSNSESNYHMVLGFESGFCLKIYSESVVLSACPIGFG